MCVLDSKIDIVLLSLNNNVSSVRALMLIYVSTPPTTHTHHHHTQNQPLSHVLWMLFACIAVKAVL
jgi:hypothetical protein